MEYFTKPLISIITINYNSSLMTAELIESVEDHSYANFEIIVIDNGSNKEDPTWLKKKYPKIILINSEKNRGFAGGNNLGVSYATGEYYFFLNNDTLLTKEPIEPILNIIANSQVGIVSPKIKFHNTNLIQYAGNSDVNKLTGRSKRKGYKEVDHGQYDNNYPTSSVHGAAMMISRENFNRVGKIPEAYFLYYEELDWCEQIKKMGLEIWYVGKYSVLHKESMSIGKNSPMKTYYMTRSRILFMRRNSTGISKVFGLLFLGLISFPKNILFLLLRKEYSNISAVVKAIIWNFKNAVYFL
ncbi:MAG: glycosyltransferase family 2 protein [Cyclobacteriaceae bacterium]|nr:glycosyltransferase family 2 protein [Cyclobacteriaceae bacterium]